MNAKEDNKVMLAIVDELFADKESEPFRTPVDYKGNNASYCAKFN